MVRRWWAFAPTAPAAPTVFVSVTYSLSYRLVTAAAAASAAAGSRFTFIDWMPSLVLVLVVLAVPASHPHIARSTLTHV